MTDAIDEYMEGLRIGGELGTRRALRRLVHLAQTRAHLLDNTSLGLWMAVVEIERPPALVTVTKSVARRIKDQTA